MISLVGGKDNGKDNGKIDLPEDMRNLVKDLRFLANKVETGQMVGVAVAYIDLDETGRTGMGNTWAASAHTYALLGAVSQLTFEFQAELYERAIEAEEEGE